MLHRLLVICVVGFWLAMSSLMVVRELYPESTRLNSIPVGYVGQRLFQHHQSSDLQVYAAGRQIGALHMEVQPPSQANIRELDLHGILNLPLPIGSDRRLTWLSRIEMTSQFEVRRFHVAVSTQEPSQHLDIDVDCVARTAGLAVKMGGRIVEQTTITLDENGLGSLLAKAGIGPAMLQQIKSTGAGMPALEFRAQTSATTLSGEKLATSLLTLRAGDQTVFEAHVSQIGQVLKARLPLLGYNLAPFNASP